MAKPRDNKPVIHTKKHLARLEREQRQTRIIMGAFILIVVAVVGLLGYGYLDQHYLQGRKAVAKVGNVTITVNEWQARVRLERTRYVNQYALYQQYAVFGLDVSNQLQQIAAQLSSPTTIGQNVLDQMINEEIIRQETAKRGITVSSAELDAAIQASYNFFPNGTPTPTITPTSITFPTLSPDTLKIVTITPTPTEFMTPTSTPTSTPDPLVTPTATIPPTATATLGPTSTPEPTSTPLPTATPYTLQGFQDQYKQGVANLTNLGLTESQIRDLYEVNLLRDKLFDVITANVPRTQEEVWARHILVKDLATAQQIETRLANGEDFATVAQEVSIDTGSASKGGDLGWFGKGVMVPEFEQAAFSLKVGEISQPVQSQYGFHIIQVLAHETVPLDASAYDQARQTAFTSWLNGARTEYNVKTFDIWQTIVPTDPAIPTPSQ